MKTLGLYSNELLRIIHFTGQIRGHGLEEVLRALINFTVSYDSKQLSPAQCRTLADFCLVEYDRPTRGFAVAREVIEWARYFADVNESGKYGAVRGNLRRLYLLDTNSVRHLEALVMNIAAPPVFEWQRLQEMELIRCCGDELVLRPDVLMLFRDYHQNLPAGRVTLHSPKLVSC